MSTPVPPPVQRQFVEPPPVIRQAEAPPVQNSPPAPGTDSRWRWWPDHPGKRVMLLATACWLALLIPAYLVGLAVPYALSQRESPDGNYIYRESSMVTAVELAEISAASGAAFAKGITLICFSATAVGGVMLLAVEPRR